MKILLFDMDGVLLQPGGYHKALAETVRLVGAALGYQSVQLTPDDIAAFEALGITSEWDSSSLCLIWMMLPLWERFPSLSVPSSLTGYQPPEHNFPPPRWEALFEFLDQPRGESVHPMLAVEKIFETRYPGQTRLLEILENINDIEKSLTQRIFQEHILGSHTFAQTYSLAPWFETESYLQVYDRSNLTMELHGALSAWLGNERHRAVIFTNRPSMPPAGHFGTPEAEIGARLVGLDGLPIIGSGDIAWMSTRQGVREHFLRKPSPPHALGALLRALRIPQEEALAAAASPHQTLLWEALQGAEISVFEDTTAGIKSALAARDVLKELGISIDLRLNGVTTSRSKQRALEAAGATVYRNIADALGLTLKLSDNRSKIGR